ncbi:MAG: NAD(P)-dependent oxidoreductase [Bacteroidales bacterium]|nr:NAD(P)-dependent oxidoreductase [Bacteroidales bacterium]
MIELPEKINSEEQLDELISRPYDELVNYFSKLEGDILILGINGKIGPSLARMARRACDKAGVNKTITGVDRNFSPEQRSGFNGIGITTIEGDLLDVNFVNGLPEAENIVFLAGMKFGAVDNLPMTWAINSYLPAIVAEKFKKSTIAAFSTGCVYPLVPVESGGSVESDLPVAIGEYAQSCLGRERMFEYGSLRYKTKCVLIRLNYSVEMRYGVLVDIATKVQKREPIDLSMGFFNVIWQGDVNNFVLRSLQIASSPARVINLTGPDILSVRQVAGEFGTLMGIEPIFVNRESETALLSNSSEAHKLFGLPRVGISNVIKWIAGWLMEDRRLLGKPTHFEVRDGKY